MIINFAISRNNDSEKSLENSIHAREEAELALMKKNDELEKANQELDRFVYSASHDMRAPLSSLLGLLEIVRLTNKDEELNEYFGLMKKRILTMEGFIKEITDYSRNSRTEIKVEKIRLKDLINEVLTTIEFLAHDAAIERKLDIPSDLVIHCDVARLKVVMSNLITNSIKYHSSSKSERWFKVSARDEGNWHVIEVSDNGIGIADQYKDKIFDMFFRATEGSEGSGLGLYIVRETVEKLAGKISCSSKLGEGSTFTLRLPNHSSGFPQPEAMKETESMASNPS
jgi:signal transduction histidine kinase